MPPIGITINPPHTHTRALAPSSPLYSAAEFYVYKIARTFRNQHVVEALDGDGGVARAVQESCYKQPLQLVAACLAPALAPPGPGPGPGHELGTDSGGNDTAAANLLLGVGVGQRSAIASVVEVGLGTMRNRNGTEGASTATMAMRCDNSGMPFEPRTFGVEVANMNIDRHLAKLGMERDGRQLFVVRADGGLTAVLGMGDLEAGWRSAPSYADVPTLRLHVAIRLRPAADVTAKTKKAKKKNWDPMGSGTGVADDFDDDEDDDEGVGEDDDSFHAKRRRVYGWVGAFWRRMGWAPDMALMSYHTQHICKNKEDMAAALQNKEVTMVPPKWPHNRDPQPQRAAAAAAAASSSSSSSSTSATPGEAPAWILQLQMMQHMIQQQQQQQQQPQVVPNTPVSPAAPADQADPTAPATVTPTPAERMATLGEWLRGGIIDDDEYKAKKQKILADL